MKHKAHAHWVKHETGKIGRVVGDPARFFRIDKAGETVAQVFREGGLWVAHIKQIDGWRTLGYAPTISAAKARAVQALAPQERSQ